MTGVKTIDVTTTIPSGDTHPADDLRRRLNASRTLLLDVMGSPGAGKTALLLATIARLRERGIESAVIDGDIASTVDAEKMEASGVKAVQLHTGGACHLDASMVEAGLNELDLEAYDLVAVENVGDLVDPARFDTGAHGRVMLLSVPEGHDRALKYPLMFTVADCLVVTKTDCLADFDFDMAALRAQATRLNPALAVFEVSVRTGEGMAEWCEWVASVVGAVAHGDREQDRLARR